MKARLEQQRQLTLAREQFVQNPSLVSITRNEHTATSTVFLPADGTIRLQSTPSAEPRLPTAIQSPSANGPHASIPKHADVSHSSTPSVGSVRADDDHVSGQSRPERLAARAVARPAAFNAVHEAGEWR